MQKIQNKKVINRISARILAARGKKNLVTILAIMLTAILFTALFTVGGGMLESIQNSTMRQVGSRSMVRVKFILPKDYEKLAKDPKVKNPSYRIYVGQAINEKLAKVNAEVNYAEDENARCGFTYPTTGTMPKEPLEIATSTVVLDALEIPHQVGAKVTLEILIDNKIVTEEFTLSGYWEGDVIATTQQCYVSKEYCNEVAATPETSFAAAGGTKYAGYLMMDFDYANSWNIQGKTMDLLKRNGYDINQVAYGVNWAYTAQKVDGSFIGMIAVLLGLILASGYLIIYNIFSLNIVADIKGYGLLKTIGTTEKQIKALVIRQALFLSVIGIPCGLLLGVIVGKCLFPFIVKWINANQIVEFSIHPLVIIGAAVFSLLTVWISCNKPCKMAAKVSPIEAVRYMDTSACGKEKERKARKVTPFTCAYANLSRNRKKVIIVVASLSLSLILMNSVYTMVKSFDMDKYVSNSIIGDGIVTNAKILNYTAREYDDYLAITKEVRKELNEIEGIEAIHQIYMMETDMRISASGKEGFIEFVEQMPEIFSEFSESETEKELEKVKENNSLWGQVYGVDQWVVEQLEYYQGTVDLEKFKTGNYCMVNTYGIAAELEEPLMGMYCQSGDKISVEFSDGTVKEYEVMAIASIPYAISDRASSLLGMEVIIPDTEYLAHGEDERAMLSVLTQEKDSADIMNHALESYTNQTGSNLRYVSKSTLQGEFKEFINTFWIVGSALSLVLALIGILNFVNAVVTGILARKQELAMMESVGMTGRWMKCMLAWEGILYILFSLVVSIVIGALVSGLIIPNTLNDLVYFSNHFTMIPIVLCAPVLILIACVIPLVAYENMKKESVVERLRQVE